MRVIDQIMNELAELRRNYTTLLTQQGNLNKRLLQIEEERELYEPAEPTQRQLPGMPPATPPAPPEAAPPTPPTTKARCTVDPEPIKRAFLKIKKDHPEWHDADVVREMERVGGFGCDNTIRKHLRRAGQVVQSRSPVSLDDEAKAIFLEEFKKVRAQHPDRTTSANANAAADALGLACSRSYIYSIVKQAGLA